MMYFEVRNGDEKALEVAKDEVDKVASEMGMSTEELQVAVMTARAETDREIERIEEMEKETLQCHKEYSANTRKQVSALKAEALRAHASMVSSTEKQKLKILYLSKELALRQIRAMNMKKLVRDFSILRQARDAFEFGTFTFEREAQKLSLMKQQQIVYKQNDRT